MDVESCSWGGTLSLVMLRSYKVATKHLAVGRSISCTVDSGSFPSPQKERDSPRVNT
jgi:hypothetical protein